MNKQQLAARIWASANEMRSKIEANEYKDYILGFIFYKFLSEKEEAWLREKGLEEADMPTITEDDPDVVEFVRPNLGYFIAYENLYSTWLAKGGDFDVSDVTDALSAFSRLVDPHHKHVFDRIFETLETGLSKLGDTSGARIKAISGLPANIFFGTGIPTIVMVLRKSRERDDILIIDASKGFVKEGKNNKLRASDIRRIADAYEARASDEGFCRVVPKQEVRDNDYNLNIPRYVDSSEREQGWDIYATMFGGIPTAEVDALGTYWQAFPGLKEELFEQANPASMRLACEDLGSAVRASQAVARWQGDFETRFRDFEPWLYEELVDELSLVLRSSEEGMLTSELFARLEGMPLVDRYDAYQILDDEWQQIAIDLEVLQTEREIPIQRKHLFWIEDATS